MSGPVYSHPSPSIAGCPPTGTGCWFYYIKEARVNYSHGRRSLGPQPEASRVKLANDQTRLHRGAHAVQATLGTQTESEFTFYTDFMSLFEE